MLTTATVATFAAFAAFGSSAGASPADCRSGTVSVTVKGRPVTVCVRVGTNLVMHGGGTNVDGYWPGLPTPTNRHTLLLVSWSSTGMTGIAIGGETPSGSQPSSTSVEPGTMTAHFKALAVGTSKVTVSYQGKGRGYPLKLTVDVVPKD